MKIKGHKVRIVTDDFIYIEDKGNGPTITNDAEDIIFQLGYAIDGIGRRKVYYKDSFGDIDEIALNDGKFSHFIRGDETITNRIKQMLKRK